ncbi:MAG: hypothetical protein CM1200mP27_12860 [Chloroflexota bacterium]|nr:MAG: hypothetical protein CM1200mP27_12860 [Chloroflexota bacterium]
MSDETIAAIHEYRAPAGFDANDAACTVRSGDSPTTGVSDSTFQALQAMIGDEGVVDVLVVSGYYHTLAHSLQALDVDLPKAPICPNLLSLRVNKRAAGPPRRRNRGKERHTTGR